MSEKKKSSDSDKKSKGTLFERRKSVIDRRCGYDLRKIEAHLNGASEEEVAKIVDRRKSVEVDGEPVNLDRRRGPGIRRSSDRKAAEEGEMTDDQFDFLMAMDRYKRGNQKPFPTWTEVLEVVKALGYRKIADPCTIEELKDQEQPTEVNG